jgi:ABC-type oligopeptide transport system substrate-binding subunit/DNA-binding SARP family transcriptional activator
VNLTLNTLGRLEILWDGRAVPELTLRKSQALLIYLALNPGSHDRSRLAGLLWGGLPEENARRNLRHALHTLRRSLDPQVLDGDRLSAGLNPELPLRVDVLEFEAAIGRAGRSRREGQVADAIGHLETALDLYQGDFLAGFDVADGAEFEEWVGRRRAQLRQQVLEGLDGLVTYWTRRGAYERALRYARRQLALEPLWERSHRQLMTLLALTGRRSAALAQYQACRRLLEEELGLEPLEETEALHRRLVNWEAGRWAERAGEPLEASGYPFASLPFTGRGEEHATLVSWWEEARRGASGLTLVEGEAGVGKTRLVEEILRYIEPQGTIVLRGRCHEFGTGLPYQPIAQALRSLPYIEDARWDALSQLPLSPVWLAELSRLLPELRQIFPNLPPAQTAAGETARQRLFEAVTRFVRAACDTAVAGCLFLDDLHWADSSSLDVLHYLIRHLEGAAVWVVGTYRPEEMSLSHPLTRLRQGLGRDGRVERLILEPLSGESVQALARSLVGERDSPALGDFLYRESEGNPFVLVETLSALQEQGALTARGAGPPHPEGGRLVWDGSAAAPGLPAGVQDVILQRVGRLSELAQRLLALAAVVGQPFDASLLHTAAGPDAAAVAGGLEEWLARRLIRPVARGKPDAGPRFFDFSHDKIRATIYHAAGQGRRQLLHRRVGEALERMYAGPAEEYAGLLAYHWERSDEPQRATGYLLHAGDRARLLYAHREAVDYYRRALALQERQGEAGREQAAHTLMKLGLAHHGAFEFPQARQAYTRGFELWQRAGKTRAAAKLPPAPHPLRVRWLEPTTLDPSMSPDTHTSSVLMQLFSGLVRLSTDMDILPDVAHTWDVSEDGRRYVFHLRSDVRWSDGVPVTAGDFEYAWKRALDPATRSPAAGCLHDVKGARAFHRGEGDPQEVGVQALDETTLAVELEEPAGHFLQLLVRPDAYPVPRHVVQAHGAAWTDPERLVTNGPFRLETWRRGEVLVLSRNPDHHSQGRPGGNVQRVELYPLTDWSDRLQHYEAGGLDVLGITFFPQVKRELARQRHAGEYVSRPILETCYVVFDVNRPPFDDVRVRRAFTLATDRETLAEVVLQGYATAATGGLVPHGMPGHSPDSGLSYDPERARRLLAEAGYPDGQGFPGVSGLAFHAVASRTAYLHTQWQDVLGVEVEWHTPEWPTFLHRLRNERHHLLCVMWVADYPDPDNFLRVSRGETWRHWRDERYDGLVEEARRVMGQERRMELYRQADGILVAQAPLLPLTYEQQHLLVKPWISYYPTAANKAVFWKDVVIEPHDRPPGAVD